MTRDDLIEKMARAIYEKMMHGGRPAAEAALTAIEHAGYVIFPLEATDEMRSAYEEAEVFGEGDQSKPWPAYSAMVAKRPFAKD